MLEIVISLRKLAPHLKSYIGPWLCAQFDPENVVRSAAKSSFAVHPFSKCFEILYLSISTLHPFVHFVTSRYLV
jgi:hypothetical protein